MPVSITADRIRQRRKELGISADSLAEKIGVSRATMFRYENGDIEKVPVALIPLLAISLHTTPSYLMGWDKEDSDTDAVSSPTRKQPINTVKIAGRDGSYIEKRLSDEQIKALKTIIDQMPDVEDI